MQRVIHRSLLLTLEIVPSGLSKRTAQEATGAIAGEWLRWIDEQVVHPVQSLPPLCDLKIYVRHFPLEQGAHIQILLCWIVLQAHRQEISEFDRSPSL